MNKLAEKVKSLFAEGTVKLAIGFENGSELEDGIRLAYDDFLHNPMRAER